MGETLKTKERDYMFDVFRGLLMMSIPISHFTKASGNWYADLYWTSSGIAHHSPTGFVYITINVFVMQAFMFLSGYFSKKPEKARATAFRGVLWPYLVFTTITMIAAFGFDLPIGHNFSYAAPSFALWFLLVLFFYRFFLPEIIKFKWALPMSITMMLIAGLLPLDQYFALGRAFSYFPFFMIGYYCSKETLDWVRTLKKKPVILTLLAVALVWASYWFQHTKLTLGWYLLKTSYTNFSYLAWYEDVLYRAALFCVACGWIVLMVNILPSKKNFLSHVGVNTMPVYIFHLGLRQVMRVYGLYVECIATLIVAWFAGISLFHKVHKNWIISTILTLLSIGGTIALAKSGVLVSLYGKCPENMILFYVLVFGSAILAGASFTAPFWVKLYDIVTEGFTRSSFITILLEGGMKAVKNMKEETRN